LLFKSQLSGDTICIKSGKLAIQYGRRRFYVIGILCNMESLSIAIVQTPHSALNLSLPAGMERVALEELRLLTERGHKVNIYANKVSGKHPNVVCLGKIEKITHWNELFFLMIFLALNFKAKLRIGFYTPLLALLAPKKSLIYFHGEAVLALPLERYQWASKRYNQSQYLFCSDYVRKRFIERHPQINKDKLFTLYNGVDPQLFLPSNNPRRDGWVRFSFHGRWVEDKGILVLLEAIRILEKKRTDFEFFLGGSPEVPYPTPRSIKVGERVNENVKDLRTVRLYGAITYNKLPAFIQNMDFGIVPSVYPEPFGIVNLEYMACGLPVVATRVGGIPEIVTDRETGLLVEPNDPQALASAIEILLDNSDLRIKMGKAARKHVEKNFTWEKHIEQLLEICQKILDNKK
jgi:glycosyltransferase involved in cell wall biosynthesis